MTTTPSSYAAFVSYAHRDDDRIWAAWISRALENWRTPTALAAKGYARRIGRVFRDEEELAAAPSLPAAIHGALREARHLIVVCSREAAESHWVNDEISYFRSLGRADRIVAVLVDGDEAESLPTSLPSMPKVEVVDVRESVGPSLRHRRQSARMALVRTILGCSDEELQEGETQRRLRRVTLTTVASIALALAATALVLFSFDRRAAAEEARAVEGDRMRRASELTSFMMYDLYERLESIGRLDLLGEVVREVTAYYDTLPARHRTPAERMRHANIQRKLGAVLMSSGDTSAALERLAAARDLGAKLLAADPSNPSLALELIDTLSSLATVYEIRGAHEHALELHAEALRLAQKRPLADPGQTALASRVARQNGHIGRCLRDQGDLDSAQLHCERALAAWRTLTSKPGGEEFEEDLATAHLAVGEVARVRGQLSHAIRSFRSGAEVLTGLADRDSRDLPMQQRLGDAQHRLTTALEQAGRLSAALEAARAACQTYEVLTTQDPLNLPGRTSLAVALSVKGRICELLGRHDEELEALTRARDLLRDLTQLGPTTTDQRDELGEVELRLAEMLRGR